MSEPRDRISLQALRTQLEALAEPDERDAIVEFFDGAVPAVGVAALDLTGVPDDAAGRRNVAIIANLCGDRGRVSQVALTGLLHVPGRTCLPSRWSRFARRPTASLRGPRGIDNRTTRQVLPTVFRTERERCQIPGRPVRRQRLGLAACLRPEHPRGRRPSRNRPVASLIRGISGLESDLHAVFDIEPAVSIRLVERNPVMGVLANPVSDPGVAAAAATTYRTAWDRLRVSQGHPPLDSESPTTYCISARG